MHPVVRLFQFVVPEPLRPRAFALRKILRTSGGRVLSGPFKGMRYFPPHVGLAWPQRLIGTYEIEAQAGLERLRARPFARVVNVGAGEGYYAVGCALMFPKASVVAFETQAKLHALIGELAAMNGVRVDVRGTCDIASLRDAIGPDAERCLIMMDVEGAEVELLDPAAIPQLARTSIVLETHEAYRPGLLVTLAERFAATHAIDRTRRRPLTPADLPFNLGILTPWLMSWASESRPIAQEWWTLTPR